MKSKTKITGLDPQGIMAKLVLPKPVLDIYRHNDKSRFKIQGRIAMPKYQRGSVSAFPYGASANQGAGGGSVVMSGQNVSFFDPGGTVRAGIVFNSDGSIDEQGPLAIDFNQVDAGEWWSDEPDAGIGSSYDVRTLSSGATGTWASPPAAHDTWIQISADRIWYVFLISKASPDVRSASSTFEIRATGSGSALDSAAYSCSVEN